VVLSSKCNVRETCYQVAKVLELLLKLEYAYAIPSIKMSTRVFIADRPEHLIMGQLAADKPLPHNISGFVGAYCQLCSICVNWHVILRHLCSHVQCGFWCS